MRANLTLLENFGQAVEQKVALADPRFHGPRKSQLTTAKFSDFDPIAFACCASRNRSVLLPSRENPAQQPRSPWSVRSLRSVCRGKIAKMRACSGYFAGNRGRNSLQFRNWLAEMGIRTIGTGLKPVRADVYVSYTESRASRILCDCC
jgi:hypothetical protein